jgi:tetratricopeptide (TPR) repeat protein
LPAFLLQLAVPTFFAESSVALTDVNSLEAAVKKGGQPEQLLNQARELVEKEPGNARVHFVLAKALQNAGMYELAVDAYRRAMNMDPAMARARLEEFRAIMSGADLEPAMKHYLEVTTTFPDNPSVVQLRNLLKARWGTVENGWELYLQALAHGKRLKGINAARGWELYVARDYKNALKYADADMAIDSMDPEFQALQGRALLSLREYAKARVPLQKAFRRSPYEYNSARDLTRTYLACGTKELAVKTALFYLTLQPEDRNVQEMVARLLKENSVAVCQSAYQEAATYARYSNRAGDFHVGYANVLRLIGDSDGAARQLNEAVTRDRRNVKAQIAYAQEEERHGHFQQALETFEYALLIERDNKKIALLRDRMKQRLMNQPNDVASQLRNALRTGKRGVASLPSDAASP